MAMPLRAARGLAACVMLLLAACATPADLNPSTAQLAAQPLITRHGRIPESATDEVLAIAAGGTSRAEKEAFEKLTDAVRKSMVAPLVAGNQVTALVDGPQTFAAIDAAVLKAKHHVHVETYIFSDDELGEKFAQLLIRKRKEGLEVRVIYDAVGSLTTPKKFFDELRDGGVDIIEFHPISPVKTWVWKFQNRDHRKIIVVDGTTAFTGGINISGAYSSASVTKPGPKKGIDEGWRDTHVRIVGPVASQFQEIFLATWGQLGGKIGPRSKYFPEGKSDGDTFVSAVASKSGEQKEEEIYRTYMAAIGNASKRIWITQAYFAPPAEMRKALLEAVRRGVDVRVIVPGFTDSKLILYAAHGEYDRLLEGGVRIIERQDALLHAKTALIDNGLVII
ncbi:MAG TPA: phospholipase D-like domain-containing protein, partial [Steroidobacteraceae bacterium]|nr:phospholipase D-like domain-containing protein [Steroidobacteraceae bacterium]